MSHESEKVIALAPYRERCPRCIELEERIGVLEAERRNAAPALYPAQGDYGQHACPFCGTHLLKQCPEVSGQTTRSYTKKHERDLVFVPALPAPSRWFRRFFRWWRHPCGIAEAHLQRLCYWCGASWCERAKVLP